MVYPNYFSIPSSTRDRTGCLIQIGYLKYFTTTSFKRWLEISYVPHRIARL
jgi:hypothetical protein